MSDWKYLGAAFGGPIGLGFGASIDANNAQSDAAKQAQAQNAALIQQQMQNQIQSGYTANDLLYNAVPQTQDYLAQGYGAGGDFATQGLGQQRQDLLNGSSLATGAIGQGQNQSLAQLYAGGGQGVGYINSGLQSGTGAIGDRSNNSQAMLSQPGGLYGNLQMDPGYKFRFDQGEQALRNAQAAQGGSGGGAAQKALVDYGQNMASQEYSNAAQRQLSAFGAAQGADAQSLQAQGGLAGLYANAGSQASQLAYGMGQQGAGIMNNGAQSLANIYAGTGTQLGGQAANAGQYLGGMSQNYYGQLGNLNQGLASQMGQNIMNGAGAAASMTGQAAANNAAMVPYAGQKDATIANAANQVTNLAGMYAMAGGFGGGTAGGYNPAGVEGTQQFIGPPQY